MDEPSTNGQPRAGDETLAARECVDRPLVVERNESLCRGWSHPTTDRVASASRGRAHPGRRAPSQIRRARVRLVVATVRFRRCRFLARAGQDGAVHLAVVVDGDHANDQCFRAPLASLKRKRAPASCRISHQPSSTTTRRRVRQAGSARRRHTASSTRTIERPSFSDVDVRASLRWQPG